MADVHVISEAVSELLGKEGVPEVARAVRGEMFFHLAEGYELLARSGPEVAREARQEAARCRQVGRSMLGGVA